MQQPPLPISRLTCGFCGFVSPHFNTGDVAWAPYYRAVYVTGLTDENSSSSSSKHNNTVRLSGLGYHRHSDPDYQVPPHAHQRFDEVDPLQLVRVYNGHPPLSAAGSLSPSAAWGFLFHDACWSLLEQAVRPDEVDVDALWRILVSVPCGSELPNWGHNYGGLYMGLARDQARGEHFVLMGPNSNVVIPSTFRNPFKVPDLEKLVRDLRITQVDEEGAQQGEDGSGGGGDSNSSEATNAAVALIGTHSKDDPFSKLPQELRELLMCYIDSADAVNARLASRNLATVPLSQQFFRSRFWPGREMHVYFDGFLLPDPEMRGTDWTILYRTLKTRVKYNHVCLGERNRLRIWNQTIKPLALALGRVSKLSGLKGGPQWKWGLDGWKTEADWNFVKTARSQAPAKFGEVGRTVHRAEVELSSGKMKGVYVSLMNFFRASYITGLRFTFEDADDVELGYMLEGSEQYLKVDGTLYGFYPAVDECGFRALAVMTGYDLTMLDSLELAGEAGGSTLTSLTATSGDKGVRRVRAAFDGFRLQALFVHQGDHVYGPA